MSGPIVCLDLWYVWSYPASPSTMDLWYVWSYPMPGSMVCVVLSCLAKHYGSVVCLVLSYAGPYYDGMVCVALSYVAQACDPMVCLVISYVGLCYGRRRASTYFAQSHQTSAYVRVCAPHRTILGPPLGGVAPRRAEVPTGGTHTPVFDSTVR